MGLKDVGNGLVKFWPIILFCLGGIVWASTVYADFQGFKASVANTHGSQWLEIQKAKDKAEKADERFRTIEMYLTKIGTKLGVDFSD
jgi:hypothetical protein